MNTYITQKVCSNKINFKIKEDKISFVEFVGGCEGNLKGISSLIKGMNIDDAIKRLEQITCGPKDTSCPDQLAKALVSYKDNRI